MRSKHNVTINMSPSYLRHAECDTSLESQENIHQQVHPRRGLKTKCCNVQQLSRLILKTKQGVTQMQLLFLACWDPIGRKIQRRAWMILAATMKRITLTPCFNPKPFLGYWADVINSVNSVNKKYDKNTAKIWTKCSGHMAKKRRKNGEKTAKIRKKCGENTLKIRQSVIKL